MGEQEQEITERERAILGAVAFLEQGRERVKQAKADEATAKELYEEAKARRQRAENEHDAEHERFLGLIGEGS